MSRSPVRVPATSSKSTRFLRNRVLFLCCLCRMMCCFLETAVLELQGRGLCRRHVCGHVCGHHLAGLFHAAHHGALRRPDGAGAEPAWISGRLNLSLSFYLLGSALTSLATSLAGLTVCPRSRNRQMAAGAASAPRRVLCQLPADADAGCLSGGQPRVDRHGGAGVRCAYFCPVAVLSRGYFQKIN